MVRLEFIYSLDGNYICRSEGKFVRIWWMLLACSCRYCFCWHPIANIGLGCRFLSHVTIATNSSFPCLLRCTPSFENNWCRMPHCFFSLCVSLVTAFKVFDVTIFPCLAVDFEGEYPCWCMPVVGFIHACDAITQFFHFVCKNIIFASPWNDIHCCDDHVPHQLLWHWHR